jgi:elongation factor Ts
MLKFRLSRLQPHHGTLGRTYSTQLPSQAQLVAQLRKRTNTSIVKAREALVASDNDIDKALHWLEEDLSQNGEKKAKKLEGRVTSEGLVAVAVLSEGVGGLAAGATGSVRVAIVELNCETDFVARNDLFGNLAKDIAHTAAFFSEYPLLSSGLIRSVPLEELSDSPLLSSNTSSSSPTGSSVAISINTSIQNTISKLGEKISLRRLSTFVTSPPSFNSAYRVGSYVHGSIGALSSTTIQAGRIASLVALRVSAPSIPNLLVNPRFKKDIPSLSRSLARQIVGLPTTSISSPSPSVQPNPESEALYDQPFLMLADGGGSEKKVGDVMNDWVKDRDGVGEVEVVEFVRWGVGEDIVN